MRTTALVLIVAAGSWMATASSPVVLSDLRLSKAASRAVLLPTEEFQADRLERNCLPGPDGQSRTFF